MPSRLPRPESIGNHVADKHLFLASDGLGAIPEFLGGRTGLTVAFVPTAVNVLPELPFVAEQRDRLTGMGLEVVDLDLDAVDPEEIASRVAAADMLFVTGGNVFYLLQRVRETPFEAALRTHVEAGKPYAGTSSGSMIIGPDPTQVTFSDRSLAPRLTSFEGLGIVEFEVFPHLDWEELAEERREMIAKATVPVVPLLDDQAVIVEGDTYRVVASP
jgi:dipeptidase E